MDVVSGGHVWRQREFGDELGFGHQCRAGAGDVGVDWICNFDGAGAISSLAASAAGKNVSDFVGPDSWVA